MSATGWFYVQDDKRLGPVDVDHIVHLVVTTVLPASALVWHHGLSEWTEADRVPEIVALLPPPLPPGKARLEPPPLSVRPPAADKAAEHVHAPATPRIEELRHRLAKEPNPRLFAQLAEELRKGGDFEEAIRVCREGVERSPAYPSLRLTLGRALLESGDLPAARAELETVLQAAPDNILAERSLGECLEAMGDRAGARARYLKALALAPGDTQLVSRLRALHGGEGPATNGSATASAPAPVKLAPAPSASSRAAAPPGAAPASAAAIRDHAAESDPLAGMLDDAPPPPNGSAGAERPEPVPARAAPDPPPIPLVPVEESFEIERADDHGSAAALAPAPAPPPKRKGRAAAEPAPPPPAVILDDLAAGATDARPATDTANSAPAPPPLPTRARSAPVRPTASFLVAKTSAEPETVQGAATVPRAEIAWPTGRLADHEFADLVAEVYSRHWSGLLTLNHMGVEKSVRVQEGRLVFAFSSSRDDRLGELLLRRGRITLHQYVEASRAMRKGVRLGTVLVEQKALDPRELVKAVMDHTQEIIYSAFQWTEGLYHFTEGGEAAEAITLKISTPDVILEGIRRIELWSRIERAVGGMDTRYARTPGYEQALAHMTLSLEKLSILTGMDLEQDLGTICRNSTLSHFEVCRTLWAFRVIGVVRRLA